MKTLNKAGKLFLQIRKHKENNQTLNQRWKAQGYLD